MVYFQKMTPEGYKQIKDEIACLKKGRLFSMLWNFL